MKYVVIFLDSMILLVWIGLFWKVVSSMDIEVDGNIEIKFGTDVFMNFNR